MLLFLPAVPASAGGGIDLQLEQALALQGATFELGDVAGAGDLAPGAGDRRSPAPESDLAPPDLSNLEDSSRMHEVAAEKHLGDQARDGSGFGRWLKKYWYIPVLAAAAIIAVSDDGSDGPEDEED